MSIKEIVKNTDLSSIYSIIKLLKTFGKSSFGSEPLPQIPPPLLMVGAKLKPGLSARNLAAKTISKLEQQGIPMTDDIFGGEQNKFSLFVLTMSQQMINEIQTNMKIDAVIPPGSIQITAVGGNAGGPIVVQGANNIITPISGGGR
tara:strand:+ start:7277 stop:7714 length:438 start_codon:yes stop_codon:yes gene_type:complete